MPIQIASLFAKIGADTSELNKGLQGASSQIKDTSKNMKVELAQWGLLFAGVGIAAKKAFEFGKKGAEISQTTESFQRLGISIGDLRTASSGTIDDMTLMKGALTLTAGASEILQDQLLTAAPRLLEIAKAANKLNPTLGDTAFMYESIATGVKRGSPLILDNLGIMVKVGEANERYAESLGKTVEGLTAEEKQIALLNETMRSGDRLIEQVGGTTDSATDSYAQMETAAKNLANELKTELGPALDYVVGGMADQMVSIREIEQVLGKQAVSQAYVNNMVTAGSQNLEALNEQYKQAVRVREYADVSMDVGVALLGIEKAGKGAKDELEKTAKYTYISRDAFQQYNDAISTQSDAAASAFAIAQDKMQIEAYESRDAFLDAASGMKEMSKVQLGNTVIGMLETMKETGELSKEQFIEAKTAAMEVFGILQDGEGDFLSMMQEAVAKADEFPGGFYEAFIHIRNAKEELDKIDTEKTIRVRIEETIIRSGWTGPVYSPGIVDPSIPDVGDGTSGGQSSNWNGDINVNGAGDPNATASAVIQSLQDRGIIRGGGYR